MPSPKSPLSLLCESMAKSKTFSGVVRQMWLGVKNLSKLGTPGTIVMYPRSGPLSFPTSTTESYRDVDLEVVFRLWGEDIDHAWHMRACLLQVMDELAELGGPFWVGVVENWDDDKDTSKNGQDVEVIIALRLSASARAAKRTAKVEATSMTPELAVLLAELGPSDTQLYVASTYGLPPSGILYIDDEKLSYSAVTSTSFVGLLRGLGGTTAVAHALGAAVRVTPSP